MVEKIAFLGSHGTGKTTSAFQLAAELKMKPEYGNTSIGIIAETARECPFPINQDSNHVAQEWIFHRQIIKEYEMGRIHDVLICDRSVLDVVVYTDFIGVKELADRMFNYCVPYLHTYSRLIFKKTESNPFFIHDGTRDMDPHYRLKVEDLYLDRIDMLPLDIRTRIEYV